MLGVPFCTNNSHPVWRQALQLLLGIAVCVAAALPALCFKPFCFRPCLVLVHVASAVWSTGLLSVQFIWQYLHYGHFVMPMGWVD